MGNAVRLAQHTSRTVEDVDWSRRTYIIPGMNIYPSMNHANNDISGKKLIAQHIPETNYEECDQTPCQLTDNRTQKTSGGYVNEVHVNRKQTHTIEPQTMQAFGDVDSKFHIIGNNIPVTEHGKDSQKYNVKYYVVQQGQQPQMDVNVAPYEGSQERSTRTRPGQGLTHLSRHQVFYLNQLYSNTFPAHRQNQVITSHSELRVATPSGSPGTSFPTGSPVHMPGSGISDHAVSARKEICIPQDRAKDVVPGTEDKYRTPRSSFLNKRGNIKRPMNAFMVWARGYRSALAARYKGETNSQISIKLGDIWNRMSLDEKMPFYGEAEVIKNRHKVEFPDWVYRPSSNKKRAELPAHDVHWPRFSAGPSSAALASLATAAANRTPMDFAHLRLDLANTEGDVGIPEMFESRVEDQHEAIQTEYQKCDIAPVQAEGSEFCTDVVEAVAASVNQQQQQQQQQSGLAEKVHMPPRTTGFGAKQVLKAKLCGKNNKKRLVEKGSLEKDTEDNNKATMKSARRKERVGCRTKSSNKTSTATSGTSPPSSAKKKRKKTNKSGRSQRVKGQRSSPRSKVEATAGTDINSFADGEDSGSTHSDTLGSPDNDGWPFPFPAYEYGPFDPLSPREVPSDDILGNRCLRRDSDEDSARPEEVTSDMYLDIQGWKSLMTPTVSTTKLTDEDVCQLFTHLQCEHGLDCRVCSSAVDLTPRPLRDTLRSQPYQEEGVDEDVCSLLNHLQCSHGLDCRLCSSAPLRAQLYQEDDVTETSGSLPQGSACPCGQVSGSHLHEKLDHGSFLNGCSTDVPVALNDVSSPSSSSVLANNSNDCDSSVEDKHVKNCTGIPLLKAETSHDVRKEKFDLSGMHTSVESTSMVGCRTQAGIGCILKVDSHERPMGVIEDVKEGMFSATHSNMHQSPLHPDIQQEDSTDSISNSQVDGLSGTKVKSDSDETSSTPSDSNNRKVQPRKTSTICKMHEQNKMGNARSSHDLKSAAGHLRGDDEVSAPDGSEGEGAEMGNRKNRRSLRSRDQTGLHRAGPRDAGGGGGDGGAAGAMPRIQLPQMPTEQDDMPRDEISVWPRTRRQSFRNRKCEPISRMFSAR